MIDSLVLEEAIREFARYRDMAEKAMAQVSGEAFFRQVDPESNSIAVIVKHLAGNLRSRWSDFLTTDGEKEDRDRDGEFVMEQPDDRAALERKWNEAWEITRATLAGLKPSDLQREVRIRGEPHTVLRALNRNLTHLAYHVGQITFLAKHLAGERWQTLSIPRNKARVTSRRTSPPR
ncbi:MAG TPA: DUF1572 family protein [Spirochaetia bacterium]|nr:DUF1572 family protein [Spirochaetia bacterium]